MSEAYLQHNRDFEKVRALYHASLDSLDAVVKRTASDIESSDPFVMSAALVDRSYASGMARGLLEALAVFGETATKRGGPDITTECGELRGMR